MSSRMCTHQYVQRRGSPLHLSEEREAKSSESQSQECETISLSNQRPIQDGECPSSSPREGPMQQSLFPLFNGEERRNVNERTRPTWPPHSTSRLNPTILTFADQRTKGRTTV